jgi:hypothetical protein
MKARSVPTAALVTIGVLTVASCGSTSDPGGNSSGDYAKDGSFTTIVNTDPGNLHPLITNLTATQAINSYTNDSLLAIDLHCPDSGKQHQLGRRHDQRLAVVGSIRTRNCGSNR